MGTSNNNNINFTSIIIYNNVEVDKLQILSDNKGKTGIYMWIHKESGKKYIGSAVNIYKRLKEYYTKSHLERNNTMYINNAILQHGYVAFSLTILEHIDISNISKEEARKLILSREQYYLDLIFLDDEPNTYNILSTAGSRLGSIHSAETIAKISGENHPMYGKIHTEKSKALMSEAKIGKNNPRGLLGKTHSAEAKVLMSEAKIGENHPLFGITGENHPNYGKTHCTETITKMSVAKGGGTIYIYDTQGTLVNSFSSARKAAKNFNIHHLTIIRYLKNNLLFQDKWYLSFSKDLLVDSSKDSLNNDK